MPIHIILGKPGSGKSMYATDRLILELAEGVRNVVTNLPLRPEKLNEYLQRKYPDRDCRMPQRLKILTDEELREFWKFRGPESVAKDAPSELEPFAFAPLAAASPEIEAQRFALAQAEYQVKLTAAVAHFQQWYPAFADSQGSKGVAYFLDEAHIAFNARDWATLGRQAIHYMSQHRKLGDVVWPITQSPGNLDKQFRSVAEDFTVLRNEYTAKFGIFRGRGRFVRRTYLAEPTGNAEPFETASFSLERDGVAACYDTARGIGVHGNKADIGRRAKGIPIWTVFPMAACLAMACVFIPWLMGKGVGKAIAPVAQKAAALVPPVERPPIPKPAPVVVAAAPEITALPEVNLAWVGVSVRGVAFGAMGARVLLSNGRTLESGDGTLKAIHSSRVELLDGTTLYFVQAEHRTPAVRPATVKTVVPARKLLAGVPAVPKADEKAPTGFSAFVAGLPKPPKPPQKRPAAVAPSARNERGAPPSQ